MRVFLTGGTGLIGRRIVGRLLERNDEAIVLTRRLDRARQVFGDVRIGLVEGDPMLGGAWQDEAGGCDAVINLAGHNLFAQRWSAETKRLILQSRAYATGNVVAAIARAKARPRVLVQASAIGYYGPHGDEELTEASPPGEDFMARVCRAWEEAARPVEDLGVRLAVVRTGVVLAKGAGALKVMTPIFRWLPGGAAPVGNGGKWLAPARGTQWLSWIHADDIAGLYVLALDSREATGPINGAAPHPVRNAEFGRALANVLRRDFPYTPWFFLPIGPPDPVLKLALGEVADVVVKGQKVLPTAAQRLGYRFVHSELSDALAQLFAREAKPVKVESAQTA